jgi:cephalosporin hydroxylase
MQTLKKIYENYNLPDGNGDKGTAHTYIDEYEKILEPFRKDGSILEIGISWGLSLRMWREYFINGIVAGVDINIQSEASDLLTDERYKIFHADATKPEFVNQIKGMNFDIIIDDGSHFFEHQIASFNLLKEFVNLGGYYIIEDVLDIDSNSDYFKSLHKNYTIIDNRSIKGRHDDVLVIYQF